MHIRAGMILLLVMVGAVLIAAGAGAYEFSSEQQAELDEFLAKYPDADADGDGALTPTEVWLVRSTSKGKGPDGAERGRAATALMQKIYTPPAIDQSNAYGPAAAKKIKVFICSGQSNMAGQGLSAELSDELLGPNDRILMFEGGKWQPLRPLKPTFGPEIAFAHAIAKAWPNETIGIVKQAKGGTGVLAWHPQWTKEKANLTSDGRKGNLWKELTDKVREALDASDCEVMGFLWQQGAKDMQNMETAKSYLQNLKALVEGLRKETKTPEMPLVLGSYRTAGTPDDLSGLNPAEYESLGRVGGAYVLKAQWDAQKAIAPAKTIIVRDLDKHERNVHLNTKGQLELGRLFAEGYLELTKQGIMGQIERVTNNG